MNVYILKSESYWANGEHVGSKTHGVYATKELAQQVMHDLPEWGDEWRNVYIITEHELQGQLPVDYLLEN